MLAAAAPVAAQATPQDRYYERSFVLAANQRCGHQPQVSAALNAAAWRAPAAALRAEANDRELADTARRARARATSTPAIPAT